MLKLLEPTKVPKGRSYFSHDDRERDGGMRGGSSRGFYRGSGRDTFNNSARDNNDRRAPIGWRNLDSRSDANGDRGRYSRDDWKPEMRNNRTNFNPRARIGGSSEGAWRHDMFAVDHEDEKMIDESKEAVA